MPGENIETRMLHQVGPVRMSHQGSPSPALLAAQQACMPPVCALHQTCSAAPAGCYAGLQGMLLASGAATPAAKQRRLVGDDDDEEEGQLVTFYIPQDVLESQRRPRSSSKPSGSGSSKPSGSGGSAGWKGTPGVCCFLKLAQAAQAASAAALPHTPALQERRGLKRPPQAAGAADARQQQQQQEGPIDLTDS